MSRSGRRKARARRTPKPGPATTPPPAGRTERVLRASLFVVLGLLLLTPFVIDTGTVFPFIVGKALWSRSLIATAFALWAVLALAWPRYRPPRSWLLVLLAAGLAVSLASAWFGASFTHSLWSNYERMLGVLDQAHWVALALVLASVLRDAAAWRALIGANVIAAAAIACTVIARAADIEVPFYGALPERSATRMGGPLGNSSYLSIYMLANLVLAAAFSARAWAAGAPGRRSGAYGWTAVAALLFGGFLLAGSVGGFAGLLGAAGFALLAFMWFARGRRRVAAVAALAVLSLGSASLVVRAVDPGRTALATIEVPAARWPGASALRYVGRVHVQRPSVQSRLAAWEAGLEGFAERPLLGWGPGNFDTVFGLFGSGYAATSAPHDQAHGKLVELAATTGLGGLSAWLALWMLALAVLLRTARAADPPDRVFAVFVAAAVAGHLVQLQFLFDTAVGTLFATIALAYAAALEPKAVPRAWWPRVPSALSGRLIRFAPRAPARAVHAALAAAAVSLAIWGLAVNRTILIAADARHVATDAVYSAVTAEGIEAFPPLADFYRRTLFFDLARNWNTWRSADPQLATHLLEWADREADAAVRSQPRNWRIAHELARLYAVVAATRSGYADRARRHLARARELAPQREVFPAPLEPPSDLASSALPGDGFASGRGIELRWSPAPGAGFHQIARSAQSGAWSPVLFSYDPEQVVLAVPDCSGCRYRIRACRTFSDCSPWALWP